jgi:hypothetical protein
MKKYLALIYGTGKGCDYTIACNQTSKIVEADNEEIVVNNILKDYGQCIENIYNEESCYDAEAIIDRIIVYEIKSNGIIFEDLASQFEKEKDIFKKKLNENRERKLYEELKKKFK